MSNVRIIARLDIKYPNLIKGIHLEGVRVVGDPKKFAEKYYEEGIDEILYMDAVATLYERNSIAALVSETAENVFVPIAVGGGIRTLQNVDEMLRSGADKVSMNTALVKNPDLIVEITRKFGSQCLVLSIEAKKKSPGHWEVYTDHGREKTGVDVFDWMQQAETAGVGEILLTSVDCEGTCQGFDVELIKKANQSVQIPIVASGGVGRIEHVYEVIEESGVEAVAMAHVLHYGKMTIADIKDALLKRNIPVREC